MQINALNDFAGSPEQVFALLTDEDFLGDVCAATGTISHRVAHHDLRTAIERSIPAPSAVRRFVGDTLTTVEVMEWQPAAPDGSRAARLTASVPGLPVTVAAEVKLGPGGRGTLVSYDGTFSVNIPLLGRKLEEQSAPAMLDVLTAQQRLGNERLAG